MRILTRSLVGLVFVTFIGCTMNTGRIVTPEFLVQKSPGGGSLSTLWYYGSDDDFHYFGHMHKVTTPYRVRREDLQWEKEFPLGSRENVYASRELSGYVKREAEPEVAAEAARR